ncbi:Beclin-1 [Lamellibrachia satsuma]|nr:Beclin-1 [Lamellibrachia satsuma]
MASGRPDAGKIGHVTASFACQRCGHPLKLDQSFNQLDHRTYSELTAPLTNTSKSSDDIDSKPPPEQQQQLQCEAAEIDNDNVSRKTIVPLQGNSLESGNGFTLLGESEPSHSEHLSHRLKVTSYLFDILSGQSEVDHPLCEECTDTLLDLLDQELKMTEDECKDYRDFLENLSSSEEETDEKALDEELQRLQVEEETYRRQLSSVEADRDQLTQQSLKERDMSKKLDAEEERYYKAYNEYKRQVLEYEDAKKSVDNQLKYAKSQLDKLKKTNVFNTTFHIWHSGHFGTINNFRLGRLPSVPVEWNEINAAWGQTVLLLHSLANKMDLEFQRYRLVPYGNHSFVESLSDKSKELPLHASGGFRFLWDTKFDQAMVAFLDCLQQFKEEVEKGGTGFSLPYKMEKGRIEDSNTGTSYSIKIQFNSEEQWTKALKFMLTNLKWGLAWVSSQFTSK